jgi:C1A family cysteine protease
MIKAAATYGDCPETEWVYDINQFATRPTSQCYTDALKDRALFYQRVQRDLTQMKACLASGNVFVFGFSVYSSFESQDVAGRGIVPMPLPNEQLLGGHAVVAVGFDDAKQRFTCRNSWSDQWGIKGYFEMPYAYLMNSQLSSDFWVIKTVG